MNNKYTLEYVFGMLVIGAGLLGLVGCGSTTHITYANPAATPSLGLERVIDPCGDAPGIIDEILLVLSDGSVLVSISDNRNGNNTRLALLPPGRYTTTDGSNCNFEVTSDGSIVF